MANLGRGIGRGYHMFWQMPVVTLLREPLKVVTRRRLRSEGYLVRWEGSGYSLALILVVVVGAVGRAVDQKLFIIVPPTHPVFDDVIGRAESFCNFVTQAF